MPRQQDPIRVLVLGTGAIGSGIARVILNKPGLTLAGAYARRPGRGGVDLGTAIGLGRDLGIAVSNALPQLVEETAPRVAIQATCSTVAEAAGEISILIRAGVHVITVAEEMAYPDAGSPGMARELDRMARESGVSVLGTGVNPGFVLDLLVIALSGVCTDIGHISARRINDLAMYGRSVMEAQGVGLSPSGFQKRLAAGSVVGHIGFRESIRMIASSTGWKIDRIDETREPIIARIALETPVVKVEPGHVAGCLHTAVAYSGGEPVIELTHPQQVHPHLQGVETGDIIRIRGNPDVNLRVNPEIPGAPATVALAVNGIPRVLNAEPGLHSVADLPVSAAMLCDARKLLKAAAGCGA